jgi:hypothetical protein
MLVTETNQKRTIKIQLLRGFEEYLYSSTAPTIKND